MIAVDESTGKVVGTDDDLDDLFNWAAEGHGRHFVVKMGSTFSDSRWRVCVWAKKEGEPIEGRPGEGWAGTAEEAARLALKAWEDQAGSARRTGIHWYVPVSVSLRLDGEP